MSRGWISLHRKILDNPILTRGRAYSRFEAFVYMLLKANHKDNEVLIGNQKIQVKKGSFITSQKKLMKEFNWGTSRLRNFLKLLQNDDMIEINTNAISTYITINNYKTLQGLQTANKSETNRKQTDSKSLTKTNNNENTVNNDNNDNNKEVFTLGDAKFITMVKSFEKDYDKEVLDEFIDYWTEKNMSGTKAKYQMQKTFDISRRLKRWTKNSKDWNIKPKANLQEYKKSTSGHYIGYCDKCNESSFYKEFDLKGDSSCCGAKINVERKNI